MPLISPKLVIPIVAILLVVALIFGALYALGFLVVPINGPCPAQECNPGPNAPKTYPLYINAGGNVINPFGLNAIGVNLTTVTGGVSTAPADFLRFPSGTFFAADYTVSVSTFTLTYPSGKAYGPGSGLTSPPSQSGSVGGGICCGQASQPFTFTWYPASGPAGTYTLSVTVSAVQTNCKPLTTCNPATATMQGTFVVQAG